ncbi:hypothetical protein GBA52_003405 [Prunus armeniaca]|nr:hypothetical protein GBA52_003405 [Prunus armeniaca]
MYACYDDDDENIYMNLRNLEETEQRMLLNAFASSLGTLVIVNGAENQMNCNACARDLLCHG